MQITLEDLNQYQALKAEIRAIEDQIIQIYLSSPKPKEAIGGRASASVPSNPTERKALDAEEKTRQLEERKQALQIYQAKIERFIDYECDDPQVRAVLRCHYLTGRSWEQTSWICFHSHNKSTSRMIVIRYFEEANNEAERDNDV